MSNNNRSDADVRPSVRPSIFAELERVKEQVEFRCFYRYIKGADGEWRTDRNGNKLTTLDPIYEEVCLIIAEVNLLKPESAIKVAGSETSAFIVQEVYARLACEHVEAVVHNFQRVCAPVYNKKAYLRTALYNVVFEYHAGGTNDAAQDGLYL